MGRRAQVLVLLTTLGSIACGKAVSQGHPDAAPPDGTPSAMPLSAHSQFEKGDYRAKFAAEFTKNLELSKGADGFFIAPDYQWKLEETIKRAVPGKEVPDDVFRQMDNAVLAQMLGRLFKDWAHNALPEKDQRFYHSVYVQNLYRCYTNLRYLEVLSNQPMKKADGDMKKLIDVWSERDQKAWQMVSNSPFFGIKKDPTTAGFLEKPLMPFVQRQIADIAGQFPNSSSNDFKALYLSKIQLAVLDMVLPAINLEAIRDRQKRAGLTNDESGFNERMFEDELKGALMRRAKFLGKNGAQNPFDTTERRVFDAIGAKFEEFGRMEHPLAVYEVTK